MSKSMHPSLQRAGSPCSNRPHKANFSAVTVHSQLPEHLPLPETDDAVGGVVYIFKMLPCLHQPVAYYGTDASASKLSQWVSLKEFDALVGLFSDAL